MKTYTKAELEQFKAAVAAVQRGDTLDVDVAHRFALLGWLKQLDEKPPMRWAVTALGNATIR